MNLSDLWIGDNIMSTKSGKIGTYEGAANGKARLRVEGKIYLVNAEHIVRYEEKVDISLKLSDIDNKYKEHTYFGETIDLHIERLNPSMANANPIHILEYQIRKCKSFLDYTVTKRRLHVVIIHGKGTGQLKQEVINIIKDYKEVVNVQEINNGGAQELHLMYY